MTVHTDGNSHGDADPRAARWREWQAGRAEAARGRDGHAPPPEQPQGPAPCGSETAGEHAGGNALLAAALAYARWGWPVLPLHHVAAGVCSCGTPGCKSAGKHPRTAHGSKDASTDPDLITAWWKRWPTANVGIATGPLEGAACPVWMLGPDHGAGREALRRLEAEHGPLPETPRSRSGSEDPGAHHVFSWPADGNVRNRTNHLDVPIDVRGEGGLFVAPPSLHASGNVYSWEIPPGEVAVPEAPPWLLAWVRDDGKGGPPPSGPNAPPAHNPRRFVETSAGPDAEARAVAYLEKCPAAVSGKAGHAQTFEVARAVVYGFDLGPEVGFRLLSEHYNPRCKPPWSERELAHKCQEADSKPHEKPRGWLLNGDRPGPTGQARQPAARTPPGKPAPAFVREIPPYRPFPLDALPPTLRDYVGAAAAALGCDPSLVALPALAVAAGCVGNSRAVLLKRGWNEPPIVWALTVAPSGRLKSPAFDKAVDPLLEIQMDMVDEHQTKAQARSAWEKKPKSEREQTQEPEDPGPEPCCITSDATIEAVGELLRDTPRGLLLARDELDGWFQGFTRFKKGGGATDRPHWLELHRAHTLRLHRLTRERGPLSIRRACCSLCGTIQPSVLARCLDAEARAAGLGARFLMAMPPQAKRAWTEAEVGEDLAAQYKALLKRLLALPLANARKRTPHFLALEPAAKRVWVRWFNRWSEEQLASQDEQAAVLAKLEGYAPRLALLHYVVACAAVESNDVGRQIGEASMSAGIRLVEWFAHEAWRVYATFHETEQQASRRRLVEWIAARGGRTSVRHLQESCRGSYPRSEDALAALQALADAGLGDLSQEVPGPKGGRPTQVFRLRAGAHETHKTPPGHAPATGGKEEASCHGTSHGTSPTPQNPRAAEGSVGFVGASSGEQQSSESGHPVGPLPRPGEVSWAPAGSVDEGLSQDDLEVMAFLLLGGAGSAAALASVTGREESALRRRLDALVTRGVLVPTLAGGETRYALAAAPPAAGEISPPAEEARRAYKAELLTVLEVTGPTTLQELARLTGGTSDEVSVLLAELVAEAHVVPPGGSADGRYSLPPGLEGGGPEAPDGAEADVF